ncbi:cytochrome P450 [Streptomyces sp. B1866]|uniref:cytochrome P450 n=1 Tax=Streptomyces sp. B1866 TaxID=3075431 RepID=UPI0028925CDB|nr:cytochrome P450 [Streptomyces sp. B1866]MDT3397013.1 cytochrome P450 [Streptomyces sp. B1866]
MPDSAPPVAENPAFPMARACPFSPPPAYARLTAEEPVSRVTLQDGRPAWLITRHDTARRLLVDPRVSSDRADPGFPEVVPGIRAMAQLGRGFLLLMDQPEHTVHRRLITGEFTLKRVRAMRPRIQEIVDEHVTALLAAPDRTADLVETLAMPVPSLVICDLLGVPYGDHPFFQRCTNALVKRTGTDTDGVAAFAALREYLGELVTAKDHDPGEDLLSRLVVRYRQEGLYDHELLTGIAMLQLIAGIETTANMIPLGVAALLRHPGQLADLRADPDLMPGAVDELLRYFGIADMAVTRVAAEDIEIDGTLIRKGDGIVTAVAAVNHDERVFPDPGALDIRRDARQHMGFGHGIHLCLGANLARLELEIVWNTLFARAPGLRLAVPERELPFKTDDSVYGLHRLDVTW